MKDIICKIVAFIIFAALFFGCLLYGTSAKVWYAGEHTVGCDGTDDCGCYERLINSEKDR